MKRIPAALLAAIAIASASMAHAASAFPDHPVRIIVGFPPGGGSDGIARILAEHMGRTLKQAVIVENKPGANSTLGAAYVASARPDGYTLLFGAESVLGADKVAYAPTVSYGETSFTPINRIASSFFVLATKKDSGLRTFADVAAKARQSTTPMFIASPGGTYPEIVTADLKRLSGLNLDEVLYKGGSPAVMAVLGGDAPLTFMGPGAVLPMAREGKLNAVAITLDHRSQLMPDVPTLAESGVKGFAMSYWYGLMGPKGLPDDVVRTLFDATSQALGDPAVQGRISELGYETMPMRSPQEFRALALKDGAALRARVEALPVREAAR
ncbi:Argininosuccinate lyase (plasmid) [Variovorax sp. SRS16]|uniref:tripartite tricarboxylate transporter substrate binding protein n=1 Tax=Variovorax sp. SRS16 TaxID=282217 RepID=UPI001319138D|nr:tripartite tricarboxylate transporter substrate binding protein [Variovorax sp. SRS16]VTU46743.1 Argininosuccinate lyase [Variovorax sp. SRS16]